MRINKTMFLLKMVQLIQRALHWQQRGLMCPAVWIASHCPDKRVLVKRNNQTPCCNPSTHNTQPLVTSCASFIKQLVIDLCLPMCTVPPKVRSEKKPWHTQDAAWIHAGNSSISKRSIKSDHPREDDWQKVYLKQKERKTNPPTDF